jgi:hypothetical protein
LEVHEKRDLLARGFQVVDALGHMFVAELIHTFQFEDKFILDDEVRDVLTHAEAFVAYGKVHLGLGIQAA